MRSLPQLSSGGWGVHRLRVDITAWIHALSYRLRRVRVACGDWSRVCGASVVDIDGMGGVFLDPPYSGDAGRDNQIYAAEDLTVSSDVTTWCEEAGKNPRTRIALCGYEGEHDRLEAQGWDVVEWKPRGGYDNQGAANENRHRERIWFSPACLAGRQGKLF